VNRVQFGNNVVNNHRLLLTSGVRQQEVPAVTVQLDPITDRHLRESIDDLAAAFAGIFSHETIERYVREALDPFADAHIPTYIPLLAYRYNANGCKPSRRSTVS
jgi:hypothetical protein